MTARQRDADCDITLVGHESAYFYSRTALMYAFMDKMKLIELEPYERSVFHNQRISLRNASMIDCDAVAKTVTLSNGEILLYDKLVLALGAVPNLFPWGGLDVELQRNTSVSHADSAAVNDSAISAC